MILAFAFLNKPMDMKTIAGDSYRNYLDNFSTKFKRE
jgi:hypothetical protein